VGGAGIAGAAAVLPK
jgi:hypothetical protein